MSEEEKKHKEENDSSIYYILGGVVLVAAVAGFFLLKPKSPTTAPMGSGQPAAVTAPQATPTPGPITKLACEKYYYNPVVGFPQYFLSMEGVDTVTTGEVTCEYTIFVKEKQVGSASITSPLNAAAERNGGTFRCQTPALELAKGIPTLVKIKVTNPEKTSINCEQTFVFP